MQLTRSRGRHEFSARSQVADGEKTRVPADGPGLLAHELHPVVVLGVVAGRDHDATVHALVGHREIDFLGPAFAQGEDIHPGFAQAADDGLCHGWAGQADIMPYHHPVRVQEGSKRPADAVGQGLIKVVRDPAANIVGFEAGKIHDRNSRKKCRMLETRHNGRRAHGYSRRAVLIKQKRGLAHVPDSLCPVCRPTG